MWHEGVAVVRKEMENEKVKKYIYEEPYLETRDIEIIEGGNVSLDFDFSLR